ncbi:MAG: rod shape-determining protein RodA [Myxococcota bacterium]|nr:rod shape-determining protein RodA [Myxococcota bacterium]MDW8361095.1 rod shape-determining protein RodA [Myxococcales bacterium]
MRLGRRAREAFDWPLFIAVAALAVIGVINLYSASSSESARLAEIYVTQIYWLTLGAGTAVLVAAIDYRHYERLAWWLYGGATVLLGLVLLVGKTIRGSSRWIEVAGFTLQPSEIVKLAVLVALAKVLHRDPRSEERSLRDLLAPGLVLALPMVLILLQPDLGTAVLLALIFATVMLLVPLRRRSLVTLLALAVGAAPLGWHFVLADYQRDRLRAFFDPTTDVLDSGWHARQSLIAIGSGGLWGKGFMQGTQNQLHFLPDQYTDFPFAVWAEEQGLLGVLLLLALYAFVVLRGLHVASLARDRFGAVLAVGVCAFLFWHTVINLGMVMGLLPVVGVTLPLFSYGGSNVFATLVGIGLLTNVSIRRFST